MNRKCPIINENIEQSPAINNTDVVPPSTSNDDHNSKLNSKVTVSIQSNEDKAKENVLSLFSHLILRIAKKKFLYLSAGENSRIL